jgi:hypothetical protein
MFMEKQDGTCPHSELSSFFGACQASRQKYVDRLEIFTSVPCLRAPNRHNLVIPFSHRQKRAISGSSTNERLASVYCLQGSLLPIFLLDVSCPVSSFFIIISKRTLLLTDSSSIDSPGRFARRTAEKRNPEPATIIGFGLELHGF